MIWALLRWLFILAFCIIVGFIITFSPSYLPQVTYKGRTIPITRDEYGVATIHASSMEDYLYGLGTIFAEDRLFQMNFRSYVLQGRMSEILGEKPLDFDRYMRQLNLKKWAEKRAARFKAQNLSEYMIFTALTNGINDRVAAMRVLPMEFYMLGMKWENYTMNHFFYFAIQVQWGNSWNANDEATRSSLLAHYTKEEIEQILPNRKQNYVFKTLPLITDDEIPERLLTKNVQKRLEQVRFNPLSFQRGAALDIIQFFPKIEGSNGWVVGGQHTQSGFPIIVNDPHQQTSIPSTLYQFKLNYTYPNGTSALSVGGTNAGSSHQYGSTPYYTLAVTTAHTDSQDFYREKVEGNKYLVNGKWHDLKIRNQTILVKTANGIRQDIYQVRETHRGPIIRNFISGYGSYDFTNDSISLTWTGYNDEWQSHVRFTYVIFSQSFEQLRDYLQNATKTYFAINIMAGTVDNHIVTQQSGLQVIRRVKQSGNYVKDGTNTDHDWVGLVPAVDRIHVYDPPKGYFVHANNKVAESNYYGGLLDFTTYSARADRIDALIRGEIAAGRKINVDFAKRVLVDTVDIYCQQILPEIIAVIPQSAKVFQGFDCDMTATSYQASIYEVFFLKLYHLMKPIHPGKMSVSSFYQMGQRIFQYMRSAYHGDESKRAVMRQAWAPTLDFLTEYFKTDDKTKWEWGLLHVDHARHTPFRNHPILSKFFDRRFPGVGNFYTICMTRMEQSDFGNFEMSVHPVYRMIVDMDPNVTDWYVSDTGVSENILSSHYTDQWELFKRSQMIPIDNKPPKQQASQL